MIGAPALGLVVQGIVLSWILKIEKKCDCSKDWRRDFMKFYSIFSILFAFVLMVLRERALLLINKPILGVLTAIGIVNLASILTYIPSLKKRECTCAIEDDWRDNFIFWWTLIGLLLMIIVPAAIAFKTMKR
jgi:amino acid permease